jgi:hypothetical protein
MRSRVTEAATTQLKVKLERKLLLSVTCPLYSFCNEFLIGSKYDGTVILWLM